MQHEWLVTNTNTGGSWVVTCAKCGAMRLSASHTEPRHESFDRPCQPVALDDKAQVAIVADQELLEFLISAVTGHELLRASDREYRDRVVRDLRQLHESAF